MLENKSHFIGKSLTIINKSFKFFLKNSLKEYDLNSAEGLVLLILFDSDGSTQEQIIEEIQHDKGVMTRTMQSLEEKEYVKRYKNNLDNRSFRFYLTDKAKLFKEQLISILKEWNNVILNGLNGENTSELKNYLEIMVNNSLNYVFLKHQVRGKKNEL